MKRLFILMALLMPIPVGVTGCKTATVTPGQVAPTYYSQAAATMDGFSTTLLQAQSMFATAHQEQLVDDASYQRGQQVFLQIALGGEAIVGALKSTQSQATIQAQINALISQVATVPQAFAIKNPQSQAAFTALSNSLVAILQTVESQTAAPATTTTTTP